MNFLIIIPFVSVAYLWPAFTGEHAVTWSFHVLFIHFVMFRATGLLALYYIWITPINIDPTVEADPKKFWEYLLQPQLDTEMSAETISSNSSLVKLGVKPWQIKALRLFNSIGFGISMTDEWLEFTYRDVVWRWLFTLLIDGLITVLFLLVWREVGIGFGVLWIMEAIIYSGLLVFNRFHVKRL